MAAELFNSISGYSVGIPAVEIIDASGNIVTNVNYPQGNVSANIVYANLYRYANGAPFSTNAGGINTQLQYNNNGVFAGVPNVTWNGSALSLGTIDALSIGGGVNGYFLQTDGAGLLTWAPASGSGGNGSPGGANTQVQFNDAGDFGGDAGFSYNKNTKLLSVANISATSATVSTITTNTVNVNTTVNAVNVNASGIVTAGTFIGDGSLLSNVTANVANTVASSSQPNITSVGTLVSLSVSGNIATPQFISASGGVQTTGNANVGFLRSANGATINGTFTANGFVDISNTNNVNLGSIANLTITGGLSGYVLSTDGFGNLSWQAQGGGGGGSPGGLNTQIQYNKNTAFAGSSAFTFNDDTNTVQVAGLLIANTMQVGSGAYKFGTQAVSFAITASQVKQVIYSIPVSQISGVDFEIIATDTVGQKRQSAKISSLYYAGVVQYSEYAGLYVNGGVGDFVVEFNPGDTINPPSLDLSVTPNSNNNTVYKMLITILAP